jgi:flagellar biosynthesis chaperone FliJ
MRRFRLAALERLRGARLEEAARDLALARRLLADALSRHDALEADLAACMPAARSGRDAVVVAGDRRILLRERLTQSNSDVDSAREHAVTAMGAWRSARADLEVVQALHERHRAAVAADDARRDQRELDDLAATRSRGVLARGGAL